MDPRPRDVFSIHNGTIFRNDVLLALPGLRFVRQIGSGANGVVFEAHDPGLNRSIAVKLWTMRIHDPSSRAMAEARKLAALSHPLLVGVYVFDTIDGTPFALMELVPGITLREWLATALHSMRERCAAWFLVSKALRFIYGAGHLHGDPHPGNVLMQRDHSHHCAVYLPHHLALTGVGLKLADTGTSHVWASRTKFREREKRLLLQTANQLFVGHHVKVFKTAPSSDPLIWILDSFDHFAHYAGSYSELPTETIAAMRRQATKR